MLFNKLNGIKIIILIAVFNCGYSNLFSQHRSNDTLDKEIQELMRDADIPGMSLVIIKNNQPEIRCYGYADVKKKIKVTPNTVFQIGSCTKAFTALALAKLAATGVINTKAFVSDYIPWLTFRYKEKEVKVTVEQVMHHTSGIPWNSISLIPQSNDENALEKTIRQIAGITLNNQPGKRYEYATVNYDILALIIQKTSGQPFEHYLTEQVFAPLQLNHTTIGAPLDSAAVATGYKLGFFTPMQYCAPVYKGNNAGGYIFSNAIDMQQWLLFQMGKTDTSLYTLAKQTHMRDETVPFHGMSSYAMGWNVALDGSGEIYHDGLNPNFSAFTAFRPQLGTGVVLLTNAGSNSTAFIGERIMQRLAGGDVEKDHMPANELDKVFSIVAFIVFFYSLLLSAFFVKVLMDIRKGSRKYEGVSAKKAKQFLIGAALITPFFVGIWLFPQAFAGFNWSTILVWAPFSFGAMITGLLFAIAFSYLVYAITLVYPEGNKYKRLFPRILLFSSLAGISNMLLITLITNSIYSDAKVGYLVFYYTLILLIYLLGRWFVESNLVRLTRTLTYEMRMELIGKIFSTSYQKFEQIDRGRIYTTLTYDITLISESLTTITALITSCFTAIGAFLYLSSLAFWATFLTVGLVLTISAVYYTVSRKTNKYFEDARDTENDFMKLLSGLVDGFKEISLHKAKKNEYKGDISGVAETYKNKMTFARLRFINAFLIGESLLVILLGVVAFGLPEMFDSIQTQTILSFVIVLLYLMGPVNNILNSIPAVMQLRIARKRVLNFIKDIPAGAPVTLSLKEKISNVSVFRATDVKFRYKKDNEESWFTVGPVNIEIVKGEIIFIIGGNGSGKTTLAKLLTGLYKADEGTFCINDEVVDASELGDYFSAVFSPPVLFKKLYTVNTAGKSEKIGEYLKLLHLDKKVTVENGTYSTLELSTGQLKRLALLQCFLEDNPIYLFDEWAADQDPEYRNFFYNHLLPGLKSEGKIVIAITHDDRYFHVADKVLKMDNGQLEIHYPEVQVPGQALLI